MKTLQTHTTCIVQHVMANLCHLTVGSFTRISASIIIAILLLLTLSCSIFLLLKSIVLVCKLFSILLLILSPIILYQNMSSSYSCSEISLLPHNKSENSLQGHLSFSLTHTSLKIAHPSYNCSLLSLTPHTLSSHIICLLSLLVRKFQI